MSLNRSFDQLPPEILRDIFVYHVWSNTCSPLDLLYVCKAWYLTAISTSSVWSKIALSRHEDVASPERIKCSSLKTFALAIQRAGRASLDLTIASSRLSFSKADIDSFTTDVTSDWVSRCHSLDMTSISALSGGDQLLKLFYTADFVALECLVLRGLVGPIAFEMRELFERLEKTAFRLESLVMGRGSYDWSVSRLPAYPIILGRLRSLQVETDGVLDLSKASLLDRLSVITGYGENGIFLPSGTAPRRLTLENNINFTMFSSRIYGSLTHLTLITTSPWAANIGMPLFPSLTHLRLGVMFLNLQEMYAPRLQHLSIEGYPCQPAAYRGPFTLNGLPPKTLYIDRSRTETDLVQILAQLSSRLEELHIASARPEHLINDKLTNFLTGGSKHGPGIPGLKRLLLCSRAPANATRKATILAKLRRVQLGLAERSVLGRIDYGVYVAYDHTRVAVPHERREWPVEWAQIWPQQASFD